MEEALKSQETLEVMAEGDVAAEAVERAEEARDEDWTAETSEDEHESLPAGPGSGPGPTITRAVSTHVYVRQKYDLRGLGVADVALMIQEAHGQAQVWDIVQSLDSMHLAGPCVLKCLVAFHGAFTSARHVLLCLLDMDKTLYPTDVFCAKTIRTSVATFGQPAKEWWAWVQEVHTFAQAQLRRLYTRCGHDYVSIAFTASPKH